MVAEVEWEGHWVKELKVLTGFSAPVFKQGGGEVLCIRHRILNSGSYRVWHSHRGRKRKQYSPLDEPQERAGS